MKRIVLLFALLSIFALPTKAQNDDMPAPGADCQLISEMKRQYLHDSLQLTDKEAEKFWVKYNNLDVAETELHKSFRTFLEDNNIQSVRGRVDFKALPADKAITFLERKMKFKADMQALESSFFNEIKQILPSEKVVRYYELDGKFKREALKKFGSKKPEEGDDSLPRKKRR